MPRFFYGNFDFEEQLRGELQRSARVERLLLELASCWLAGAEPEDRIWCPGELPEEFLASLSQWGLPREIFVHDAASIPRGLELVPWGWSPVAVDFGQRHGLIVNAPPLDVVQLANSREYSVPLEEPDADGWDFATLCRRLGEVLACVERLPADTQWVIKANWSHAARERILGHGPVIPDADIRWVKQRLARDGVVSWELWLPREAEIGIQWQITPGQAPELIAMTELLVDPRGQYAGSRCLEIHETDLPPVSTTQIPDRLKSSATLPEWVTTTATATRPVVEDLAQRGYFGPVGIDAMRYSHPEWKVPGIRLLQDINARWTMGRLAAGWFQRLDFNGPLSWLHGTGAATHSSRGIATSPSMIDGVPVSHRTWLQWDD